MSSSWEFLSSDAINASNSIETNETVAKSSSTSSQLNPAVIRELFPDTDEKLLSFALSKQMGTEETVEYILTGAAQVDFDRAKTPTNSNLTQATFNRSKSTRIKLPNERELEEKVDDVRKSLVLTRFDEQVNDSDVVHRPILPKEMRVKKTKGQKETRYRDGQVFFVKPGEKFVSEQQKEKE
jgi:hypothetical protein